MDYDFRRTQWTLILFFTTCLSCGGGSVLQDDGANVVTNQGACSVSGSYVTMTWA
ncbi:MAG: hypothetical protein H7A33_06855 [Deltaproteobacteria bacterium]|nr:hypothetical protein [Deltaproteobacteria bacterium]